MRATVVLRSYNRVQACIEALERCLEQDYEDFEVLVLEQSTQITEAERARLDELGEDRRVTLAFREPLGGPGSRNEACKIASGDVIVMLDDDDMPATSGWLSAFMRNFEDPRCLAVTGQHGDQHQRRQYERGHGAAGGEQAPDQGFVGSCHVRMPPQKTG